MFDFACAHCQRPLRGPRCYQGKPVHCPGCGAPLLVADASTSAVGVPARSGTSDAGPVLTVHASPTDKPAEQRGPANASTGAGPTRERAWRDRSILPWLLLT